MTVSADLPGGELPAHEVFRAARDVLIARRSDLAQARHEFRWPRLEHFNWATDWFDRLATEQPAHCALWTVCGGADATSWEHRKVSYAEMARRSREVAGWLWAGGVRRGDPVLLALDNVVPLWELMVACIRIGAVMVPAGTTDADLTDRVRRGRVRVAVAGLADAERFDAVASDGIRIAVDDGSAVVPPDGWLAYSDSDGHPELDEMLAGAGQALSPTGADDPLLRYLAASGTASTFIEHSHVSYPIGHLSTMYWLGLQSTDVHLSLSPPGIAEHAGLCVFAPWNAGATVVVHQAARFDVSALLAVLVECGVTTFCAPTTVWRTLAEQDLSGSTPMLRELVCAGEPLDPEAAERVEAAWGLTVRNGLGRPETTALIGTSPGQSADPGSIGRPLPGYEVALIDPATGEVGDEGEVCVELMPRPLGVMTGHADGGSAALTPGVLRTGELARRNSNGSLTYVGGASSAHHDRGLG